ncbi:MAG: hypothetical protein V1754_06865 [Pseudomonadota bacterium]
MQEQSTKIELLWIGIAWILMCVPAFWILPALDDWGTSAPIAHFSWDLLRPGFFWRPIEKLNRVFLGHFPGALPFYPHLVAVLGHALSGWMVYQLCKKLGASSRLGVISSIVFLVSPAVAAAVWSVDSAVQTWSTACGLSAVWAYMLRNRRQAFGIWLLMSFLALFWKESGVVWFFAAPLFRELQLGRETGTVGVWRRLCAGIGVACIAMVAYFAFRWGFARSFSLGGDDRYSLLLNPAIWIRNFSMLVGVAATTIDTIAIFGPSPRYLVGAMSIIFSIPLLGFLFVWAVRNRSLRKGVISLMAFFVVLGPHVLLAKVSEMYAHPIVAALAILLVVGGFGTLNSGWHKGAKIALFLFLVGAVFVDAHKWFVMMETGRKADVVGRTIAEHTGDSPPASICIVRKSPTKKFGYSVFSAPPGPASQWGVAARQHWGWEHQVKIFHEETIAKCPQDSERIVDLAMDGAVQFIR